MVIIKTMILGTSFKKEKKMLKLIDQEGYDPHNSGFYRDYKHNCGLSLESHKWVLEQATNESIKVE